MSFPAMDLSARFAFAHTLADEAGALAASYFEKHGALTVEYKGPQDLVSVADREVEALIRRRVAEVFPGDGVLGEEAGGALGDALWVVDPIDGTTNFLHGLPHWAISIAFVWQGRVEVGVVDGPRLRERFAARRGGGATLNGRPIRVSACDRLDQALIAMGSSKKTPPGPYLEGLGRVLEQGAEYRRLGSAAHNLCQVACGRVEAYFEARLSPWDVAAGMLLVTEAGGRTNDYLGGGGLQHGNVMLAANPALYAPLAAAFGVG